MKLHTCLLSITVCLVFNAAVCKLTYGQEKTAAPVFKDGQAQIVPAFSDSKQWIRHDLWVETEFNTDGDERPDRMHVSVARPKQTDTEGLKVPVIYESSPYYSGIAGGDQHMWDPKHELGETPPERSDPPEIEYQGEKKIISRSYDANWVSRGFAVVHSCSPGTGRSQGCPTVGGKNESLAPKAVIDWLNGRAKGFTTPDGDEEVKADWCTGKVGMTGTSYNGTLCLAAATTGVEGLEAIIPIAPNTSYYHYYRANGLVRHPGGYMGEDIDVLYNFIHSGNPENREHCNCEVRDELMAENMDRESGDMNAFWDSRDYSKQLEKVRAATLMVHGFNDWNVMPSHSVRVYEGLKENDIPLRCFFHQGGHASPITLKMMNRWFTRYLYEVENGVEDEPKAWIVREGDRPNEATPYSEYPNPDAKPVTLYLAGSGKKIGSLSDVQESGQGNQKLVDDVSISPVKLASMADGPNRLLFATAKLVEPLHLSGTSSIKIRLSSSKPAANLSVWLISLPIEQGKPTNSNLITRGWADPQNHKSLTESEPLVTGDFYELEFELEPDDQIIPAGQQVGLMIFSSDRLFTLWPDPGTELTVDIDATSIALPVVGGVEAFRKAIAK